MFSVPVVVHPEPKGESCDNSSMATDYKKKFGQMSDHELYESTAGLKESTAGHLAGKAEIERRNSKPAAIRSWIAIGISLAALAASVVAILWSSG